MRAKQWSSARFASTPHLGLATCAVSHSRSKMLSN